MLRGNGSGGFLAAVNSSAGSGPRALVSGDFNADGRLDVATANFNANTVGLLLGNGHGHVRRAGRRSPRARGPAASLRST